MSPFQKRSSIPKFTVLEEGNSMNLVIDGMGEGTRLGSEGTEIPVHMMKINGEYLVARLIRIGRQNGAERIFYMLNKDEPEFKNYLSTNNFGIPVLPVIRTTNNPLQSMFALAPLLRSAPFCLMDPDIVFDEEAFTDFINYALLQKNADGILAIVRYVNTEKPLCVALDEEDTILKFSDSQEGYNWATGGIYYFLPQIFEEMENALKTDMSGLKKYVRLLGTRGYRLKGFPFSRLIAVGYPSDAGIAEQFLAQEERA
jgi:NDP-sugar pyrophosphorylase family protein